MMKTPEQLKGAIRSMATKKNLRAQKCWSVDFVHFLA